MPGVQAIPESFVLLDILFLYKAVILPEWFYLLRVVMRMNVSPFDASGTESSLYRQHDTQPPSYLISSPHTPSTMEVASKQSTRLLQSPMTRRTLALPRTSTAKVNALSSSRTRRRNLSSTRTPLTPETPSLFGGPSPLGAQQGGGPPTTYFSNRSSLPANTIIRFVPQQTAWIVERMGRFSRILEPGLAILVPFLDRIAYVKSLKESAIEIPSQNAITADNVTLELDGVLYTRVFDAYKAR